MRTKTILFIFFLLFTLIITGCDSESEKLAEQKEKEKYEETLDKAFPNGTDTPTVVEEPSVETKNDDLKSESSEESDNVMLEPVGNMDDWPSLSSEEKKQIIEDSIKYEQYQQNQQNVEIEIVGSTDEFIKVIDDRYQEIENLEGSERVRMLASSISAQVGIMGHQEHLIKFR
ncbi:hypothetical protein [Bacillus subtilis]|uniref:hypothetical protein n=1 Tax=Bacillus subtilis TaxID=1423 RepID=UPI00059D4981|nr:hypothetical protein [Bacillus subtilis]KIN34101.1 hypothetical protein B4068_2064 [Bacillus subtilis]